MKPAASAGVSARSLSAQRTRLYKTGVLIVSILLSLIAAEAGLRILEKRRLGDRAVDQKLIPDPDLGSPLAPDTPGNDVKAFAMTTYLNGLI